MPRNLVETATRYGFFCCSAHSRRFRRIGLIAPRKRTLPLMIRTGTTLPEVLSIVVDEGFFRRRFS
jgi:hypothetical protein